MSILLPFQETSGLQPGKYSEQLLNINRKNHCDEEDEDVLKDVILTKTPS
jgi:hypothetical protein